MHVYVLKFQCNLMGGFCEYLRILFRYGTRRQHHEVIEVSSSSHRQFDLRNLHTSHQLMKLGSNGRSANRISVDLSVYLLIAVGFTKQHQQIQHVCMGKRLYSVITSARRFITT